MYLDEVAAGASADGNASRGIGEVCVCKGEGRHGAGPLDKSAEEEGCPIWGVIGMIG